MHKVSLTSAAATALAHAMVAILAAADNTRVLMIKGPVAAHHGLRAPRDSADADLWVDPRHIDRLRNQLEARGWHLRVGRSTPSLLPPHSFTYIHDAWPCDIDLHWRFPGFFADPAASFEAVWATHQTISIAHTEVAIPSRAGAAVIGMLHSLRNLYSERMIDERQRIEAVVLDEFSEEQREEFYEIARAGGAIWVLRELIERGRLGTVVPDLGLDERRRWMLFQEGVADASAVSWWALVRSSPWYAKPAVFWRAVWVSRVDVPRNDPTRLPSRAEAWAYQRARWRRGWRAMTRYAKRRKSVPR